MPITDLGELAPLAGPDTPGVLRTATVEDMWDQAADAAITPKNLSGALFQMGLVRERQTGTLNIYVREDGNDTNDGLTSRSALATLAEAKRRLSRIDPSGNAVIVDIGEGTFEGPDMRLAGYDISNLYMQGAGVDKTIITGNNYYSCCVSDMTCTTDLSAGYNSTLYVIRHGGIHGHIRLRGCRIYCIAGVLSVVGATVEYEPDTASGTISNGIFASYGGIVLCNSQFVARNTPHFGWFAQAARGAQIHFYNSSFTGVATGEKYHAYQGGLISGQGNNITLQTLLGDKPGKLEATGYAGTRGAAQSFGSVNSSGALEESYNATISIAGTGRYAILFDRPMNHARYPVICSTSEERITASATSRTVNGFSLQLTDRDTRQPVNGTVFFAVF